MAPVHNGCQHNLSGQVCYATAISNPPNSATHHCQPLAPVALRITAQSIQVAFWETSNSILLKQLHSGFIKLHLEVTAPSVLVVRRSTNPTA